MKISSHPKILPITKPTNKRKKGHLSHLVYQPFGLGRLCLDCHDPIRYTQGDSDTPHPSYQNVYFKDGKKLNQTTICTDCHGGFYPKGSEVVPEDPKIDPESVRLLQWGDPGSVTCLQCHDDSYEHGGMYASYTSRYDTLSMWYFDECEITAPDPDRISGQNYWSKNGHGLTAQKSFAGATFDTGYPNKGAMNNENIPSVMSTFKCRIKSR